MQTRSNHYNGWVTLFAARSMKLLFGLEVSGSLQISRQSKTPLFEVDSDISSEIPDIPDAWHLNQPLQDPWSTLCIRKYFPLVRAILLVCKQSGWWFQTFFIFPYIGNYHPNWIIFFRGVRQPPTRLDCSSHLPSGMLIQAAPSGYAAQAWFRVLAHGGDRVSWRSVSSWQCLGLAFLDEITSRG